jgi:tetratricopeptide (TPR) repeat protein
MRITAKLIDTSDGYIVWSDSFDRPPNNTVQLQEDLARAVAQNLELRLPVDSSARFAERGSKNAVAYNAYLMARKEQQIRTSNGVGQAMQLYRQAIAADPQFALAYVGLAYAYVDDRYFGSRSIDDVAVEVEGYLLAAQKLNPRLSELYAVRGMLRTEQSRFNEALRDLNRAVELNPNELRAHSELGRAYIRLGRPRDALQSYTKAIELDPLDGYLHARRCLALQDMARFQEAQQACEHARALEPASPWPVVTTSWLEWSRGNLKQALDWNGQALRPTTLTCISDAPNCKCCLARQATQ